GPAVRFGLCQHEGGTTLHASPDAEARAPRDWPDGRGGAAVAPGGSLRFEQQQHELEQRRRQHRLQHHGQREQQGEDNRHRHTGYDKTQTVLRQLALNKPQLIIAHASGFDTAAQRIGQQYKIPTVTYDIPTMKSPGAVSNITTESQQASYLAGILAAHKTKTG